MTRAQASYRFTFQHGIVADGRQCARVDHMANCFPLEKASECGVDPERCMSQEEFAALEGQSAEHIGGRHFRVGRALVEVASGCKAPYGTPIRWEPLAA